MKTAVMIVALMIRCVHLRMNGVHQNRTLIKENAKSNGITFCIANPLYCF